MVGRARCTGGLSAICVALGVFPLALLSSASAAVTFVGEVSPAVPSSWNSTTDGYIGKTKGKVGSAVVDGGSGLSSNYGYLGYSSGSSGTATVTGSGSTWTNSSDLYVGGYYGTGTLLEIEDGGQVSNATGYLGYSSGSSGTATVTGVGSVWTNSSVLYVGFVGTGTLRIENGGQVSNTYGYLGYYFSSNGTATVTGTASTWTTSIFLYVGEYGTGTLNIENGARVSDWQGHLGRASGSNGTATVTGSGSTWTTDTYFYVGDSGTGTLNIKNGGQVSSLTCYVGNASGSNGTATVTGSGSTWTNSGDLFAGYSGTGTLTVENGGRIDAQTLFFARLSDLKSAGGGTINAKGIVSDADLVFDAGHGSSQQLPFGTGGVLQMNLDGTGGLGVGYKSTGTMRIAQGVAIRSSNGYLGYDPGSSGTTTVTGVGSTWTNSRILYVGNAGTGTLNVENGGQVSSIYAYLGNTSGSSGTATVRGTGSKWANSWGLFVGSSGTGMLNIENGGQVTARSLSVNSTSVVNLYVSGNNMLILGDATTTGSVSNAGKINFYADAFLSPGSYTPISELKGRTISWSGTGSYNAVGGTWDAVNKRFLVAAATKSPAGAPVSLTTGARAIITDAHSGEQVGVSVGTITGTPTFSATPLTPADLAGISLGPGESVRSGWTFSSNLTGTTLLSFDVGPGLSDLHAWRYANNTWTAYDTHIVYRDDIASFTVTGFSAYAVTAVPEPGTPVMLAIGLAALGLYWRRRVK